MSTSHIVQRLDDVLLHDVVCTMYDVQSEINFVTQLVISIVPMALDAVPLLKCCTQFSLVKQYEINGIKMKQ